MNVAERVISKFGGVTKLAKMLGHKHVTRVHGWKTRGIIPPSAMAEILEAAEVNGIPLTADELIPRKTDRALSMPKPQRDEGEPVIIRTAKRAKAAKARKGRRP